MKYRVLLVCQSGMSSSFIVNNVCAAFREHGEEIEFASRSAMELVDFVDQVNTILVAPNVTYMFKDIEATCKEHGKVPIVIPLEYYGQMDGAAIREIIIANKADTKTKVDFARPLIKLANHRIFKSISNGVIGGVNMLIIGAVFSVISIVLSIIPGVKESDFAVKFELFQELVFGIVGIFFTYSIAAANAKLNK